MKICIYCFRQKEDSQFSLEHIMPAGIIGASQPHHVISSPDVCKTCNNNSGMFIDGPFLKSKRLNELVTSLSRYYQPTDLDLPFTYMGDLTNWQWENNICECWIGPTGDRAYHFHSPFQLEEFMPSMIGIPPTQWKRKFDTGFVILVITTNNPIWLKCAVYSFIHFLQALFSMASFFVSLTCTFGSVGGILGPIGWLRRNFFHAFFECT